MARQSHAATVVLTRPAPQGQRFAKDLRARLDACVGDIAIVLSPLMQTEDLSPALPDRTFSALVLTSETGAKAAGRLLAQGHTLPKSAFCVGNRTAEAARKEGFEALSAEGDVVRLEAFIRARCPGGPLLHLVGANRAGSLSESLTASGLETHSAIVYAQRPCALTPEAASVFYQTAPVLVPVFSPRSARLLVQSLPKDRTSPLWIVAISPAAASAAEALSPSRLVVAAHPDGENMLHAVAELLCSDATA